MPPSLTFLITHHRYLSPDYVCWQIKALEAQTCRDFQVIYLHQGDSAEPLRVDLAAVSFPVQVLEIPYPEIANVCCWDLVQLVGRLLQSPLWGAYWTYLHQECLPAPEFVSTVLAGIAQAEQTYGTEAVYRINQLRCSLLPHQLSADHWRAQLLSSGAVTWIERIPHRFDFVVRSAHWSEDAFVLPVALTRQYALFSAVTEPLWFQDLFDLFLGLEDQAWFQPVHWLHLGQPVIYHLNHPRVFAEYTRTFLSAVRERPDLFAQVALFELAHEDFDYSEGFTVDGERVIPQHLHRFVQYMRYGPQGTMTRWLAALERFHQFKSRQL
jgi:hypothetical protein